MRAPDSDWNDLGRGAELVEKKSPPPTPRTSHFLQQYGTVEKFLVDCNNAEADSPLKQFITELQTLHFTKNIARTPILTVNREELCDFGVIVKIRTASDVFAYDLTERTRAWLLSKDLISEQVPVSEVPPKPAPDSTPTPLDTAVISPIFKADDLAIWTTKSGKQTAVQILTANRDGVTIWDPTHPDPSKPTRNLLFKGLQPIIPDGPKLECTTLAELESLTESVLGISELKAKLTGSPSVDEATPELQAEAPSLVLDEIVDNADIAANPPSFKEPSLQISNPEPLALPARSAIHRPTLDITHLREPTLAMNYFSADLWRRIASGNPELSWRRLSLPVPLPAEAPTQGSPPKSQVTEIKKPTLKIGYSNNQQKAAFVLVDDNSLDGKVTLYLPLNGKTISISDEQFRAMNPVMLKPGEVRRILESRSSIIAGLLEAQTWITEQRKQTPVKRENSKRDLNTNPEKRSSPPPSTPTSNRTSKPSSPSASPHSTPRVSELSESARLTFGEPAEFLLDSLIEQHLNHLPPVTDWKNAISISEAGKQVAASMLAFGSLSFLEQAQQLPVLIRPHIGLRFAEREAIIKFVKVMDLPEYARMTILFGLYQSVSVEESQLTINPDTTAVREFWGKKRVSYLKISLLRAFVHDRPENERYVGLDKFVSQYGLNKLAAENFFSRSRGVESYRHLPVKIDDGKITIQLVLLVAESLRKTPTSVICLNDVISAITKSDDRGRAKRWLDNNDDIRELLEDRGVFLSGYHHWDDVYAKAQAWYKKLGIPVPEEEVKLLLHAHPKK